MAQYEVQVNFGVEAEDDEAAYSMVDGLLLRTWKDSPACRRAGFKFWEMLDGCVTEVDSESDPDWARTESRDEAACRHCHKPIIQDAQGTWVDDTGGDVCGWDGGNEAHEPVEEG